MTFRHHDYDRLAILDAEAIGEPGSRRFRLVAGVPGDVVALWMEKEQLNALGLALGELLLQLQQAGLASSTPPAPAGPAAVSRLGMAEYTVGRMAVGYDEEAALIVILAHDIAQSDDDDPAFIGRADVAQAQRLIEQITEVVAAGRPRCPRCGAPIGPEGHVCPHDNGHLPLSID